MDKNFKQNLETMVKENNGTIEITFEKEVLKNTILNATINGKDFVIIKYHKDGFMWGICNDSKGNVSVSYELKSFVKQLLAE